MCRLVAGLVVVALVAAACGGTGGGNTGGDDTATATVAGSQAVTDRLPLLPGESLEVGVQYQYRFGIHCGMRYIEGVGGRNWETDNPPYDGVGRFPDALRAEFVNPNESISPVVAGSIELISADLLEFRAGDVVVRYEPTTTEVPGCA